MALANLLKDVRIMSQFGPGVPVTVPPELVPAVEALLTIMFETHPQDQVYYTRWRVVSGPQPGYLICKLERYKDGWGYLSYPGLNRVAVGLPLQVNIQVWELVWQWLDKNHTQVIKLDHVPDLGCLAQGVYDELG